MDFLLFQFRRIIGIFASIFSAPADLLGMVWDGSNRSNNLILGLPSVIIAVLGFGSVFLMLWGGTDAMVENYSNRVQTNSNEQSRLAVDLRQALVNQLSLDTGGASEAEKLNKLRAEDPRTAQIKALGEESVVYLKKLVDLEPDNKDHLYQLALRYFNRGDQANQKRGLGILNEIAPLDQPGHPTAHLQLARSLERKSARTILEKRNNIDLALEHVTQCLTRDSQNLDALKLKARLLSTKGATKDSREAFETLFEDNPGYYRPLLALGVSGSKRAAVLESAATRYLANLRDKDIRKDTIKWVGAWEGVFSVLIQKEDFPKLQELLEKDLKQYSQSDDTAGRVPFLKKYLCQMYISWAHADIGNPLTTTGLPFDEEQQYKLLDFFSKAYSYNEKNSTVLQVVAKLGNSPYPPIVEGARQIYDPSVTQDLPPGVLNQLALEALDKERYEEAQQHYERANTLSPNNPSILNNLAYAYLKEHSEDNPLSEDERISNASRGHRLIEQAIRLIPSNRRNSDEMSRYRHTMGTALMQLGNYPGAASQFEQALITRPTEENVLTSIIDCYAKFELDSGPFQKRLEEVRKQKQDSSIN